jgi:hypothetical protein
MTIMEKEHSDVQNVKYQRVCEVIRFYNYEPSLLQLQKCINKNYNETEQIS